MRARTVLQVLPLFALPVAVLVACAADKRGFGDEQQDGGVDPTVFGDAGLDSSAKPGIGGRDPISCDEAAQFKTYVGCDYWPTVTDNLVQDVFDFAVAVANGGGDPANVTVTGPNGVNKSVTVAPGSIGKVFLPWVAPLKTPSGTSTPKLTSMVASKSAYHLVSDRPVVVYQFNPLEFRATGGEAGKDWSGCKIPAGSSATECYSYSNDASLLLPSTAMTGNYRIMGSAGWSRHPINIITGGFDKTQPLQPLLPPSFAVTGTVDGTNVTVKLPGNGAVVAGTGITATSGGGTLSFTLGAGDVAQIVGNNGQDNDFSGALLVADKPVQVITSVMCVYYPLDVQACDHVEETVFPAETLGKHYVVMRPAGPKANDVGHVVRFFGNVDGTKLTYAPSAPAGCPAFLNAGQVSDCGEVTSDFEVSGDKEFGVATFQLGGEKADPDYKPGVPMQPQGDPSQSFAVTVEQYRKSYVFLAPTDYKTSYVDVVAPSNATITLDGKDVSSSLKPLTGTSWLGAHIKLDAGKDGSHTLDATEPVGIQVIGYGDNTSYQYPGGLNLSAISAAPVK